MQLEHKVLAAMMIDRSAWEAVREFIEERDFTAPGWLLVNNVAQYYDDDPAAQRVDTEIIGDRIARKLNNEKKAENFRDILSELPYDLGAQNIARELLEHKREAASVRLESALAGTDRKAIREALDDYARIHEASELGSAKTFTAYEPDIAEMFGKALSNDAKIKIAPAALNDILGGGALPGHCIIMFGRVEMGKSLFAINAAVGFVAQGLRVLYIENEDTLLDTQRRFIQRLLRRSRQWCMDNPEEAAEKAAQKGLDRFILTEDPENADDVEAAIRYYDPDVVVINQMRNMVSGDNQVQKLDQLSHRLRRIGKKHRKLMFMVTAAREGEVDKNGYIKPKPRLEIGDVYSSRTGIPAAADVLIGWGGSDEMKRNEQGCASICKNKLVDGGGHGHVYLSVNPKTGVIDGEAVLT